MNDRIKIGDYVEYIPDLEECVVLAKQSGYSEDQRFFPSLMKRWRIFRIGECIELVSAKSVGSLVLSGYKGYSNSDGLLDYVADAFVNPRYAISGRCLGSRRTVFPRSRWITYYTEAQKQVETMTYDVFSNEDAEWLIAHDLLPKRGMFWYAEKYESKEETEAYLGCRCMNGEDGDVFGVCFEFEEAGKLMKHYSHKREMLTLIRLRPEVEFEFGTGTLRIPWKMSV